MAHPRETCLSAPTIGAGLETRCFDSPGFGAPANPGKAAYWTQRKSLDLPAKPPGSNFLPMTVIHMSEKGQIVVPKQARDKRGFGLGSAFAFLETKDGDLVFRPVNVNPKKTLFQHLQEFKGVEIRKRRHYARPRT